MSTERTHTSARTARIPSRDSSIDPARRERLLALHQAVSTPAKDGGNGATSAEEAESEKTWHRIMSHMDKDRLIALTDAILAIIMTVLVLDLAKPAQPSWRALWNMRQSFFSYAISFFWLSELWGALNRIWEHVQLVDTSAIRWTFVLLFFASFMPWATNLDSENFNSPVMQTLYGSVILLITLSNLALHTVIDRSNRNNPVLLAITHNYRVTLMPDLLVKVVGVVLSATVWAPAATWSVLLAWVVIRITQRIYDKKTAHYLAVITHRCHLEDEESAEARTTAALPE